MEPQERKEVIELLREELRDFIGWAMQELGGEYYLSEPDQPVTSWDETAEERLTQRLDSPRAGVWERDRYAFFDHPRHASVYKVMEAGDLEIVHYLEDFYCDHYKVEDEIEGLSEEEIRENRRFEANFGVLLASQTLGWMYRLDFCEICGMIEVWSRTYDPEEIALYTPE